ncbi:MAG: hypothetical protein F6J87_13010 [Spirulina sp. SIO3F2]|nr:hypothetical protein [Spirulina sp. SIO3F2]
MNNLVPFCSRLFHNPFTNMSGVSFDQLALYAIAGEPAFMDGVMFIPAFYELFPAQASSGFSLKHSLVRYMEKNGYHFDQICPKFDEFSKLFSGDYIGQYSVQQCTAMWVRSRIPSLYGFSPPSDAYRKYKLIDISFLAIIFQSKKLPQIHPFICIEDDLVASLEFYSFTTKGISF